MLAIALPAWISGCSFAGPDTGTGSYGLLVENYDDQSHTLTVSIARQSSTVYDRTFELRSGERVNEGQVFTKNGDYRIRAELAYGVSSTDELVVGQESNPPVSDYHVRIQKDGELSLYLPSP